MSRFGQHLERPEAKPVHLPGDLWEEIQDRELPYHIRGDCPHPRSSLYLRGDTLWCGSCYRSWRDLDRQRRQFYINCGARVLSDE